MKRAARARKVGTASVPAPTGGLNAINSLADMPKTDAILMDNWVPGTASCDIRLGYQAKVTGFAQKIETLMVYNSATTSKLFASAGTAIYDATTPGAVGAAVVSGMTNARWQYVNMGTVGGQFLLAVNGADKMRVYNGTTWGYEGDGTFPAVTGFNTALAKDIQVYANRVWLVEKNSFRVWYLPLNSIGGAATSIDLSSLYVLGGFLAGLVTWQVASEFSVITYAAFVSSQGEVLLYQGSDPASASTWGKVGQFRVGRPIGQRFYERVGNDTLLLTVDGVLPMSKAAMTNRLNESDAISYKIMNAIGNDIIGYPNQFGWQMILYPPGNKLFINAPKSRSADTNQYVMNTLTNAWCRYTNLGAYCWALFNDYIYFGGDTAVYQAETGNNDNGAGIRAQTIPAYSYFGMEGAQKFFTAVRPIVAANATFNPDLALVTDFAVSGISSSPTLITALPPGIWNVAVWNVSYWGNSLTINRDWNWIGGVGFAASITMSSLTKDVQVSWMATDFTYEVGGVL